MKLRTTQFRTVRAETPAAFDDAIKSAKDEILQRNPEAEFVAFAFASSQGAIVGTLIWIG